MIVLDTHALIWWVNGDSQLSAKAKRRIEKALKDGEQVLISAITAWEIAMLVQKGRIALTMAVESFLTAVASIEGVRFVPIDNALAVQSVTLPGDFHPDPADRIITALARHHAAYLITADRKIKNYKHVKTIW